MKTALPDYRIRRSPKSKNLRLRVTREDGLLVVVPKGYDEKKIPELLKQKKDWISDAMERVDETKRFLESEPVLHLPESVRLAALGETWCVTYSKDQTHTGLRLRGDSGALIITGRDLNRENVIRKLKDWLRARVREELFPLAERLATEHCLEIGNLFVKSQRTRWASCSVHKNLSLNTKLLFLSPGLVRYVLIHELCHTVHMNHSGEFWRLLASKEPDYKMLDLNLREAWKAVPQWLF